LEKFSIKKAYKKIDTLKLMKLKVKFNTKNLSFGLLIMKSRLFPLDGAYFRNSEPFDTILTTQAKIGRIKDWPVFKT